MGGITERGSEKDFQCKLRRENCWPGALREGAMEWWG